MENAIQDGCNKYLEHTTKGEIKLKVLGFVFSSRGQGNCSNSIEYCLNKIKLAGHEAEAVNINDYDVQGCGECGYYCFKNGDCSKQDDIKKLYKKCFEADRVIFAIPTFCGNLSSMYFKFWERSQALFKDDTEYENDFLKKISFIIIGNLSSGGDMALHEALYGFANRSFYPETLLLSSREYGKSSINGDMIETDEVKNRLNSFINRVINKNNH